MATNFRWEPFDEWHQGSTLRPPPYTPHHRSRRLVEGVGVGDACLTNIALSDLKKCHCSAEDSQSPLSEDLQKVLSGPDPDWVDFQAVERGQKFYVENSGHMYVTLVSVLLSGLTIRRFSEVLVHSGYVVSPQETYQRFERTAVSIFTWFSSDLQDPGSKARQSILRIRCLHELARRHVAQFWKPAAGESQQDIGMALSQFDLAQVQMAFSLCAIKVFTEILNCNISYQTQKDIVNTWRYIGFRLGILDEYNACNSLEDGQELLDELVGTDMYYSRSVHECSHMLLSSTLKGFGQCLNVGPVPFATLLFITSESRNIDKTFLQQHLKFAIKSPWVKPFSKIIFFSLSFQRPRKIFNRGIFLISNANKSEEARKELSLYRRFCKGAVLFVLMVVFYVFYYNLCS